MDIHENQCELVNLGWIWLRVPIILQKALVYLNYDLKIKTPYFYHDSKRQLIEITFKDPQQLDQLIRLGHQNHQSQVFPNIWYNFFTQPWCQIKLDYEENYDGSELETNAILIFPETQIDLLTSLMQTLVEQQKSMLR